MHMLVGTVLHVTVLAIVGYLLLYTASRSEGLVALIGRLLGIWVFVLAALSVLFVGGVGMFGGKMLGMNMMHGDGHGRGWMHHWDGDESGDEHGPPPATMMAPTPPAPAPAPAPAKPAKP